MVIIGIEISFIHFFYPPFTYEHIELSTAQRIVYLFYFQT